MVFLEEKGRTLHFKPTVEFLGMVGRVNDPSWFLFVAALLERERYLHRKLTWANLPHRKEAQRLKNLRFAERRHAQYRARYHGDPDYRAKVKAQNAEEWKRNKERMHARNRAWQKANLGKWREYQREYAKRRRATDPQWAIANRLRQRVGNIIRKQGASKSATTEKLLGCTVEFFLKYLEARFQPGMTWDNRHLWEIDHILPCSKFDLTKKAEQRKCFHYTNCQPLWTTENTSKSAKTMKQAELI